MRILLISLYYEPDVAATGVYMARICEDLAQMGHEVTVVTTHPHYGGGAAPGQRRRALVERETLRGVRVVRTNVLTAGARGSIAGRALNYVTYNALSTAVAALAGRQDLVLAASPPPTTAVTAALVARLWRVPFAYSLQDMVFDSVVNLGLLRNPVAIRGLQAVERFIYAQADHIMVLSDGLRQNILAKGVPDDRITILPYFVDTDFIAPEPRDNEFRREHGLGDRTVVLYAGNIGVIQDIGTLLECARRQRHRDDLLFLIVGDGAKRPAWEREARAMDLPNVRFLPYQPAAVLSQMRAAADVHVAPMRRTMATLCVPSKVYEIMASGRPVVAGVDEGSETWQLVGEARAGFCVPPEDSAAFEQALMRLVDDAALRRECGESGRRVIEQEYARRVVTPRFEALLRGLVERRRGEGRAAG